MQKLDWRNTYTPTNASQVRGNCGSSQNGILKSLNNLQRDSVPGLKTRSNNSDENQQSGKTGRDLRVPVLNMRGQPLMPTTPRKAKILLKEKKAKVIQSVPFTIQLLYATGETKQPITLGIDAGYEHIGFSAVTEKSELISGNVTIRTNIPKLNIEKSMYRRTRRNKKWYRPPRFLNRKRAEGWIAPSLSHKLKSYIQLVEKIKKLLPITRTIVEVATFDTQKMQNPEIKGIEYQQGEMRGYEIREYLLEKWNRKCAYCGKTNVPLEIEHIIPKIRGGSDRVSNLTLSCHECNQKKSDKTAEEFGHSDIQKKALIPLKDAAFMNTVRWKLVNVLGCEHTYGYITKKNRISLKLDKSHTNDAFVIAGGIDQNRALQYKITQTRRNNRSLQLNRKGFKPSIRKSRYKLQPVDLVYFNDQKFKVVGMHNCGKSIVIRNGDKKMDVNIKKVRLVRYGKGFQFELQFLPSLSEGVSLEGCR